MICTCKVKCLGADGPPSLNVRVKAAAEATICMLR